MGVIFKYSILLVGEADVMWSEAFDLRPRALKAKGKRAKSLIANIIIAIVGNQAICSANFRVNRPV